MTLRCPWSMNLLDKLHIKVNKTILDTFRRRMSNGLSQVALQSCVSYVAFDELFRHLSISRWLLSLCYHGWIMVTRH